jgi:pimeloyl-ACP methyl ester carboxylesterase
MGLPVSVQRKTAFLCRPWRFLRVDQRCHGSSLGLKNLPQPSSVAASAADVGRFLDMKLGGRPLEALIGHSLGGKVVLDLLTQRQDTPPTKQVFLQTSLDQFPALWNLSGPCSVPAMPSQHFQLSCVSALLGDRVLQRGASEWVRFCWKTASAMWGTLASPSSSAGLGAGFGGWGCQGWQRRAHGRQQSLG